MCDKAGSEGHYWCNEYACYQRTRDPSLFEPLKCADPAKAEAEIKAIMKEYPHLTKLEAGQLSCLRASAQVSAAVQSSDGGGRYIKFCKAHGVAW